LQKRNLASQQVSQQEETITCPPGQSRIVWQQTNDCLPCGISEVCRRRLVAASSKLPQVCWICGQMVSLESCVVDEHGLAVHEDCSVAKIASRPAPSAPQNKPKPRRTPP